MNIVDKRVAELNPAEYNPRQLTKKQYEDLKTSIEKYGFVDPIIINKNKDRKNVIIGGHQRHSIAKMLGMETVPCFEIDLPLEEEKELNIRLNKNVGDWDWDVLANNFDVIDLKDWGFTENDLNLFDNDYTEEFSLPDGDKPPFRQVTFNVSNEQFEVVEEAIKRAKENDFGDTGNDNSNGNALWWICSKYES